MAAYSSILRGRFYWLGQIDMNQPPQAKIVMTPEQGGLVGPIVLNGTKTLSGPINPTVTCPGLNHSIKMGLSLIFQL